MTEDDEQASDGLTIDENIANLVATLNGLAGIATNSSCGGHQNPSPGQVRAGEWYIDFDLLPHQLAWQSLELIALAVGERLEEGDEIRLTVWHDGGVRFDLRGYDSDPNELAAVIFNHIS